jgi:hypothetical protein
MSLELPTGVVVMLRLPEINPLLWPKNTNTTSGSRQLDI